jgi:hypothetical protein
MPRRPSPIQTLCYLCGGPLDDRRPTSRDHVVPQQLILRDQPRVAGFDYGGVIETHQECNNRFSPEGMAPKALALISTLNDPLSFEHIDSTGKELRLKPDCLSGFGKSDFEFFGLIQGQPTRPSDFLESLDRATKTAVSVLTKSAAARLVDQHLSGVPSAWRVLAAPKHTAELSTCFRSVFGDQRPFEIGTDIHVKRLAESAEDYFVAYTARQFVLFLYFGFSADPAFAHEIGRAMTEDGGGLLKWEGQNLMELCERPSPWREVSVWPA